MVSVICESKESIIRQLLGRTPFEFVANRFVVYILDMHRCKKLPYYDGGIIIPARFQDTVGGYVAYEYNSSDAATAAGREAWGYPKKMAKVALVRSGRFLRGTITRRDRLIVSLTCNFNSKRLAMPDTPTNPTLLYHVMPRPDGPGALFRRVICRSVSAFDKRKKTMYGRPRISFGRSSESPFRVLEPTKVWGATYSVGPFKSTWGKVLATLESNV